MVMNDHGCIVDSPQLRLKYEQDTLGKLDTGSAVKSSQEAISGTQRRHAAMMIPNFQNHIASAWCISCIDSAGDHCISQMTRRLIWWSCHFVEETVHSGQQEQQPSMHTLHAIF